MIVTPQILARVCLAVLAAVILQLTFFSEITVFGVSPDIIPVLVVCLGLLGGSMIGAVGGFGTGILVDSALLQTMGASSLVLLIVGYLAGRYRELYDVHSPLVPPLLAGGLTLLAVCAFSMLQVMLGVDAPVSLLIVREILVKSLLNVFLAIPIYAGIRLLLRPALIEDRPLRPSTPPSPMGT